MWIRNKGTRRKPKFSLVESRRVPGKKYPQQKVVCHMGKFNCFKELITLWGILAKEARAWQRKHVWLNDRDKHSPLLKQHARGLSLAEINARLKKYQKSAFRYAQHQKSKEAENERKLLRKLSRSFNSLKDSECRSAILDLTILIYEIRRGNLIAQWRPIVRQRMKENLEEIIQFYNEL
jgi:hypothetical protein